MGNFNPKLPTKHVGTNKYITFFVSRTRSPTGADYRQPETGTLYSVGTVWQVGKNPTTGLEGDIWMLSKIVANVAYWVLISSGSPNVDSFQIDTFTGPGTNPVVATGTGLVTITGAQISNAGLANVIRTNSLAANTYTIQIQQSGSTAVTDSTKNGVSHYNSTHFTLGANAFVSSQIATISQIGIVILASQTQSEYNTYGTNQVVQSGEIAHMMAKPAPIGSTTPNTGAFTSLSSTAGQTFSNATNIFPSVSSTINSAAYSSINVNERMFIRGVVPASIAAGFGTGLEIFSTNTANSDIVLAEFYGIIEDPTPAAEVVFGLIKVGATGVLSEEVARFYRGRIQIAASGRLRLGPGGVDFMSGAGDPNGSVTAAKGSLYMRTDGSSTSTRAYVNTDSATAWTAVTTAT